MNRRNMPYNQMSIAACDSRGRRVGRWNSVLPCRVDFESVVRFCISLVMQRHETPLREEVYS